MSIEILDCLKRKRDICIKNIIPSQNTAFGFTPALNRYLSIDLRCNQCQVLISKMNIKSISSINYKSIVSSSSGGVSNGGIVSYVSNGVSDISIVSNVSTVSNVGTVTRVSSVSNVSIVCN